MDELIKNSRNHYRVAVERTKSKEVSKALKLFYLV